MTNDLQNKMRYHINRFIFDNGFAPTVDDLASLLQIKSDPVKQTLKSLADSHALVLHPNSFDIWVAHPFALFPTLFWVKTAGKEWWGNCTWCSFGIATLTKTDTNIYTKLKGEEEPLLVQIRDNEIVQKDYVVHFPIPAGKFWDNVLYTCSMILIFKNENEVDNWCKQHNKPKGEVLPVSKVWELAEVWYGNYLDPDFVRKTKEVAENMFNQVGLTSDFWKL
jgi:hypothetical protein